MSTELVATIAPYTADLALSDWLNHWLTQQIRPRRRQSTFLRYQRIAYRQIVPHLGAIPIGCLAPAHILEWQNRLLDGGLSPSGVGFAHTVLTGALRFALRMEVIPRNPASLVPRPPKRRSEAKSPEIRAVKDLLELAESEGHFLYPCIRLIAYTGLRRGEVCALRWPSVDLEKGYLLVTGSLVLQRQFTEGCSAPPSGRLGVWRESGWPDGCATAPPPATAATPQHPTAPGAASRAPHGTPAAC